MCRRFSAHELGLVRRWVFLLALVAALCSSVRVEVARGDAVHVVTNRPSPSLPAVPFQLSFAETLSTSPNPSYLRHAFDGKRNIYWVMNKDLSINAMRPFEYGIQRLSGGKGPSQPTRITVASIGAFLNPVLGKTAEGYAQKVQSIDDLEADREGNLYVRVNLAFERYPAFVAFRADTGRPELLFSPSGLARIAKSLGLGAHLVETKLRVTPHGLAWLFVWSKFNPSNQWSRPRMQIFGLKRDPRGQWQVVHITPKFVGSGPAPTQAEVAFGATDWNNGWVFYTGETLWRMAPNGEARPLVHLRLLGEGTRAGEPLVMPQGDFWFAINRDSSVSSYGTVDRRTGHVTPKLTFAMVGDRSRLVRVRLLQNRKAALGEIGSEALFGAFRQARVSSQKGAQTRIRALRADYSTGGISGYEQRAGVLFSLRPSQ